MRDFKSMKRQRGRNRKPGGGGGGGNNPNRAFDSNGPEGIKVRGNAQHVYERYQQLARDAASSGDRVLAENFLQHAEHYFRLIRAMQPARPVSEIVSRDSFSSGFDIDFEDESGLPQVDSEAESNEGGDGDSQARDGQGRDGQGGDQREFRRDRDNRDRDNRDRGEFRRDRDRDGEGRDNRDRDNRDRDNRDRGEFRRDRDDRPRDDRQRDDRQRDDRPREERAEGEGGGRRESRRERFERQRAERRARFNEENGEAAPPSADQGGQPEAEQPRESQPVLRGEDGGESHMPAFLGRAAPAAAPEAEAPGGDEPAPVKKPRAPRRKKSEEPAGEDA